MSGSSDSDEFYDAIDDSPNRLPDQNRRRPKNLSLTPSKSESDFQTSLKLEEKRHGLNSFPVRAPSSAAIQNAGKDVPVFEKSQSKRHKLRELRQRMQTEDEEVLTNVGTSPTNSQTSSFDGIFPGPETRSSHPFRIIEHDALSLHSLTSLGRIGRLLSAGQEAPRESTSGDNPSGSSVSASTTTLRSPSENRDPAVNHQETSRVGDVEVKDSKTLQEPQLQEPDVIASTKASVLGPVDSARVPVAPPRRKKKAKATTATCPPPENNLKKEECKPTQLSVSVDEPNTISFKRGATLPSPASTIESITREFENSLDIKAATQGQYLVKSQENDENQSRSARSTGRNSSTYPLGSGNVSSGSGASSRERRKSAGDEQTLSANQLNIFVRTRTESGKPLSDLEILEQVTVLNLDTGERVPLSIAEDKLPQCINPLSLHIMRLTSEYVSNTSLEKAQRESDDDSIDLKKAGSVSGDGEMDGGMVKRKTALLRKFLGSTVKKTMIRAKTIGRHHKEEPNVVDADNPPSSSGEQFIKIKASNSHKGPYEFEQVQHVQDLNGEHIGPIWCMKFSSCGRLLATAGQDRVLRVWVVRSANPYFQEVRQKYAENKNNSPTPSLESIVTQVPVDEVKEPSIDENPPEMEAKAPFMSKPLCTYSGHTSDLLDVAWSKNYFILTSSMDKTVRLWHISRKECLCCFQHIDCVSAICFHPRDDRYFLSGSLDGKLRLWYIPDKKVAVWNEIDGPTKLITAANFCENGKLAVVGSYDGRCIFYNNMDLKYHTTINVRSSRGKNTRGRKISGIEQMPGENKILITSNDSRIRLYDVGELTVSVKYKGYCNFSSQIKASFSHDGKFIVSGSENQCIYIWKSHHDYSKFSSVRRDRNDYWEGIKVHNAVVTCAIFSPNPDLILRQIEELEGNAASDQRTSGYVLVSADFNGCIKVFINKTKPKHSSLPASALA